MTSQDLASVILQQLAERGLAPDPDNYRMLYEELVAGKKESISSSAKWSEVLPQFIAQWERSQQGLGHLQKLQQRQQALQAGSPNQILHALQGLAMRWAALPDRPMENSSQEPAIASTTLSSIWHRGLAAGFQVGLAGDKLAQEGMQRIEELLQAKEPNTELLIQELRKLWVQMDHRDEKVHEIQDYYQKTLLLLTSSARELFEKEPWLGQELEALRQFFDEANPAQAQMGYENLKDLLCRQEQRLGAVQEADQALQELLRLVFEYLASLDEGNCGQDYQELFRLSEQIQQAEDMQQVQSLARELLERSQALQDKLHQSHDALRKARLHLENAQRRLQSLEQEICQLHLLVHEDPLTKTLNRRGLLLAFERESARANRQSQALAIALLDLDHFKKVNDRYGHEAGDQVLQQVSLFLQQGLRNTDIIARYGGEEFVILMPATTAQKAVEVLQRVLRQLLEAPLQIGKHQIPTSFSAGVAAYEPGNTLENTLTLADRALYAAKRAGRQRVFLSTPKER